MTLRPVNNPAAGVAQRTPALFRNEPLRSLVCALGQTPQSRRALTRPIPPGTPRWGAAWKKATVDNYVSAISGATHLFEEPELWSWWRNWRATGSSVISSRAARAIGVNYRSKSRERLEPEHRPSVYPAGLFRLSKPRSITFYREPAHEI